MQSNRPNSLIGHIDFWAHFVRRTLHLPHWVIEPVCLLYDWRLSVYKKDPK